MAIRRNIGHVVLSGSSFKDSWGGRAVDGSSRRRGQWATTAALVAHLGFLTFLLIASVRYEAALGGSRDLDPEGLVETSVVPMAPGLRTALVVTFFGVLAGPLVLGALSLLPLAPRTRVVLRAVATGVLALLAVFFAFAGVFVAPGLLLMAVGLGMEMNHHTSPPSPGPIAV